MYFLLVVPQLSSMLKEIHWSWVIGKAVRKTNQSIIKQEHWMQIHNQACNVTLLVCRSAEALFSAVWMIFQDDKFLFTLKCDFTTLIPLPFLSMFAGRKKTQKNCPFLTTMYCNNAALKLVPVYGHLLISWYPQGCYVIIT